MTSFREQAVLIGQPAPLVGVISTPSAGDPAHPLPGIIILNAGLVHHVGPNRLTVKMARRFAAKGYTILRFDHSGIGDSAGRGDDLSFDTAAVNETRRAMDSLAEQHGIGRFILIGLCSGAVTAFRTACADGRVTGVVMMNAQGHSNDRDWEFHVLNRSWARYYWKRSLFHPDSWWRALTGRIQYRELLIVMARQLKSMFGPSKGVSAISGSLASDIHELIERGVRLLSLHSEGDPSLDFLDAILGKETERLRAFGGIETKTISCTDHIFTPLRSQEELLEILDDWVSLQAGLMDKLTTAATSGADREAVVGS